MKHNFFLGVCLYIPFYFFICRNCKHYAFSFLHHPHTVHITYSIIFIKCISFYSFVQIVAFFAVCAVAVVSMYAIIPWLVNWMTVFIWLYAVISWIRIHWWIYDLVNFPLNNAKIALELIVDADLVFTFALWGATLKFTIFLQTLKITLLLATLTVESEKCCASKSMLSDFYIFVFCLLKVNWNWKRIEMTLGKGKYYVFSIRIE